MQTAFAVALKKAGYKPTLPDAAPRVAREVVKFGASKFVLIFDCPAKRVPEGIQVISAGGGGTGGAAQDDARRFRKVKVDLHGLMARVLVDSINVRSDAVTGYCRVYVNCTVGSVGGCNGFHYWCGAYEEFVREEMKNVWDRAAVRETGGRISLRLRGICQDMPAVRLGFAIPQ